MDSASATLAPEPTQASPTGAFGGSSIHSVSPGATDRRVRDLSPAARSASGFGSTSAIARARSEIVADASVVIAMSLFCPFERANVTLSLMESLGLISCRDGQGLLHDSEVLARRVDLVVYHPQIIWRVILVP